MNKLREQFVGQKGYHSVEEDVSVGDGMKQTFYTDAYVEWLEARDKEHLDKIEKFFKDRYMDLPRKLTSNGFRGFNTWQVKNMYGDIRLYILKIPEVA